MFQMVGFQASLAVFPDWFFRKGFGFIGVDQGFDASDAHVPAFLLEELPVSIQQCFVEEAGSKLGLVLVGDGRLFQSKICIPVQTCGLECGFPLNAAKLFGVEVRIGKRVGRREATDDHKGYGGHKASEVG